MSEVDFNEPQYQRTRTESSAGGSSSMSQFIIRMGLAKDDSGAQWVLGGAAFVIALVAVLVYWLFSA